MKSNLKVIIIPFCLILLLSIPKDNHAQNVKQDIEQIESSLTSIIHLKGQEKKKFSFEERMRYHHIPGASIAILKNGKLYISKSYGIKNANHKGAVDRNTIFQAASIAKPFTALGILKLVETNSVNLDDPVNKYLVGWQLEENEHTKDHKVTIRSLLNHTGGINVHGFDGYRISEELPTTIQVLNGEGNTDRVFVEHKPHEKWKYSGGGYVILQKLIEDLTGEKFIDFMQTEILKPLGMEHSTFQYPIDTMTHKNISSAHYNNGEVVPGGWNNYSELGAGGLWTTAEDLIKYCIEIQQIMAGKENGILKKSTIEEMLNPGLNDWGLGVSVKGKNETLRFSHEGKNEGYFAELIGFANKGDAAVILTNGNSGELVNEFLIAVSDHFKWNTHHQRVIEIQEYNENQLNQYTGLYAWTEDKSWIVEMT